MWDKAHRLYGDEPPKLIVDRLNVELGGILGKYDVVYMSAQKLVQQSWKTAIWWAPGAPLARPGGLYVRHHGGQLPAAPLPLPPSAAMEFITDGSYGCGADMPDKGLPGVRHEIRQGRLRHPL